MALVLGADAGSALHSSNPSELCKRTLTANDAEGPRQPLVLLAGEAKSDPAADQSLACLTTVRVTSWPGPVGLHLIV